MKVQTKRNLLRLATTVAAACAAAVVFLPAAAFAAPAVATGSVNVRSGPSTSYARVDTLRPGEAVEVEGCRSGWCYVTRPGPDGYVSASYLRRSGGAAMEPNFNLSFNFPNGGSFSIGSGGVSIGIGDGRPGRPGGGSGDMRGDVCFYDGANFTGARFCMDRGQMTPNLNRTGWNNRISSIRNPDGLRVTVCDDAGYDDCRTYRTSARSLGSLNNAISSIRIR